MALDFKEIPEAHQPSGLQDTFELFARDFLELRGFDIVSTPGRGADGGKDLIVREMRRGPLGKTDVRWLVSCKHFAHSGKSVGADHESNIVDRVIANKCQGFMGFYSTLPSSSLLQRLEGIANIEHTCFDHRRIEADLLGFDSMALIFKRYFPKSFSIWTASNPNPAKIFNDQKNVTCKVCGRDLLEEAYIGNMIHVSSKRDDWSKPNHIVDAYCCCKGDCGRRLEIIWNAEGCTDVWEDVSDMATPVVYISRLMGFINQIRAGTTLTDEAFEETKLIFLKLFPHVSRDLTEDERERTARLMMVPSWAGGMGPG